jgi:hypothetical protein
LLSEAAFSGFLTRMPTSELTATSNL